MDGETAGNIEDETFSADGATITIEGVSTHPGFAKGKMEHAIKIAAAIVDRLPKDTCSPETTEGKEGFLHPIGISGALEKARIDFIVRDFTDEGLKQKEALLEGIVKDVMKDYPRSTYRMEVKQQYRNMKQVIDRHPADRRLRHRGDPPRRPDAGAKPRSAAAPTARGCRSWACPAPTSSPASTRSTRGWNGSAGRTWKRPCRPSCIWR